MRRYSWTRVLSGVLLSEVFFVLTACQGILRRQNGVQQTEKHQCCIMHAMRLRARSLEIVAGCEKKKFDEGTVQSIVCFSTQNALW